ncbi:MAG TPA: hypothetical protein VNE63_11895 [Candidatus Acidoferrales bacterium]|nr:hypothetical protein [Candidatus Acidoferrales bacterium]
MNSQTQEIALLGSSKACRLNLDKFDWICILALLVSFIVVGHLPAAPSKYGDLYFHEEAKTLASVLQGNASWKEIAIARAPGPVLYYALPYTLVPHDAPDAVFWDAALAWNILWMAIAILLIRRTGVLLGGAAAGKAAAALSLVMPFAVYYSFGIAAETPAYIAAVFFGYGWALWRNDRTQTFFSSGVLLALLGLGALILCRPNALVIVGVAAACGMAAWLHRSERGTADAAFAMLCIAASLATVAIESVSLKHLPQNGGVEMQSSNFSDVVFEGSFQFRSEPWDWRFWGKATRSGSVDYRNWVEARRELLEQSASTGKSMAELEMQWTLRDIVQHPLERLKMFAVRALQLNIWIENSKNPSAFQIGPFRGWSVYLVFHVLLNAIAVLSVFASIWFLAFHRDQFLAYWPVWGLWAGLLLFHAFTYAEPRYMLPGEPGMAILAGCALGGRIKSKNGRIPQK